MKECSAYAVAWISKNPKLVLRIVVLGSALLILAAAAAVLMFLREPTIVVAIPDKQQVEQSGWRLTKRDVISSDRVCDLYEKDMRSHLRCYRKSKDGSWSLKGVY